MLTAVRGVQNIVDRGYIASDVMIHEFRQAIVRFRDLLTQAVLGVRSCPANQFRDGNHAIPDGFLQRDLLAVQQDIYICHVYVIQFAFSQILQGDFGVCILALGDGDPQLPLRFFVLTGRFSGRMNVPSKEKTACGRQDKQQNAEYPQPVLSCVP